MDVRIFTRNLDLNQDAENYIQKKFNRLERHLNNVSDAKLELARTAARSQTDRIEAQLTLVTGGYTLRGEETGPNLYAAIDSLVDVMDRQISRYKTQVYRTSQAKRFARKAGAAEAQPVPTEAEAELPEEGLLPELGKVVRTKRFRMKPMTVEDAINEMELLGHAFFLFFNIDTNEYNVLYRRQDGDYGIIEPEMA